MPSRSGYLLALLILLASWAAGGFFLYSRLGAFGDDIFRMVAPGEATLDLSDGAYTIFHEPSATVDGRLYAADGISGLAVRLESQASGEPVALVAPMMSSRYSYGGHTGFGIFAFAIEEAGRYRLSASYADGQPGPQTVLAVSQGFVAKLLVTILVSIAILLLGVGAALAIGVRTFIRRRRAARGPAGGP